MLRTYSVGYFAFAQYDVLLLHVILSAAKNPTEELTAYMVRTYSMGYFAFAQYDVLFLHVILSAAKNPTEELTAHMLRTYSVGYFAFAQYDVRGTAWDITLSLDMPYLFYNF